MKQTSRKLKVKLVVVVLFVTFSNTFAQNTRSIADIMPAKRNICVEVTFLPFGLEKPIDLIDIRGKYYITNDFAIRGTADYQKKSNNYDEERNFSYNDFDTIVFDKYRMNANFWKIQLGLEYRVKRLENPFPYFGIDFGFGRKTSEYYADEHEVDYQDEIVWNNTTNVENGWYGEHWVQQGWVHWNGHLISGIDEQAYTYFSIDVFTGMDIYIIKRFYAGFELGITIENKNYQDATMWQNGEFLLRYAGYKSGDVVLNSANLIRFGIWL